MVLGQRVVCVDDHGLRNLDIAHPEKDGAYTIRDIVPEADGRLGLRLVEIVNQPAEHHGVMVERTFHHARFRPIPA